MGFSKYANASVVKPAINMASWDEIRHASLNGGVEFGSRKSNRVVLQEYDPSQYLLSHCSIIASVNSEDAGLPTGRQIFDGLEIDRRYPDFLITPDTSKYVNNNCFVAGTMILMGDGTEKPIESVCVGDMVISHTGESRKVTETFVHPFRGSLRSIHRLGDPRRLDVTPEHPFYAMVPASVCACGCSTGLDRRSRKAAVHRFQDYVRGHGAKPRVHAKPDFGWVSAGLLNKGDFLSLPRLQGESSEAGITPGKARLLGYYLAEGYYHHRQKSPRVSAKYRVEGESSVPVGVDFALALDEQDTLVVEIRKLLNEEFGVGSTVSQVSAGGVTVYSHQSLELVRFFQDHATEYAGTKKVHEAVLRWPLSLQKELIRGWIEGDGCVQGTAGGWVSVASASSDLISQMHLILARLGVFATRNVRRAVGRKRVRVGNGSVQIVNDPTKVSVSHTLQIGAIHAATVIEGSFLEGLYRHSILNRRKHTLGFRVRDDRMMFPIRQVSKKPFEGKVYNFETDVDHSYVANGVAVHNSDAWERKLLLSCFRTFIGGENYVEHVQIPEMSKGKIIDAAARDIGDSIYVDILVATNRKHASLIQAISSGQLSTMSMGAQVSFTICTKCGNVAEDELNLCPHIKYFKGNTFIDSRGKIRRIAELCGHLTAEPGSVKFIEASWVANPAFTGAVLRNTFDTSLPGMAEQASKMIALAFSEGPRTADPLAYNKAASFLDQETSVVVGKSVVPAVQHTLLSDKKTLNDSIKKATHTLRHTVPSKNIKPAPSYLNYRHAADDNQQSPVPMAGGGSEKHEDSSQVPTGDPLEGISKELYDKLVEHVSEKVRKDIEQSNSYIRPDENESNESLIKSALDHSDEKVSSTWKKRALMIMKVASKPSMARTLLAGLILFERGGWDAIRASRRFTGREILAVSRLVDQMTKKSSVAGEGRIYSTVIAVGGTSSYNNVNDYLKACRKVIGRDLTEFEKSQLVIKGKLFSIGS